MNRIYIILVLILLGCDTKQPRSRWYTYYKDFNLLSLKGISPIYDKEIEYPFVAFFQSDTVIVLEFAYSSKDKVMCTYNKQEDYWISPLHTVQEEHMHHFVVYLYDNKRYSIEYHFENNIKYLDMLSISEDISDSSNESTVYIFKYGARTYNLELPWKINTKKWFRKEIYRGSVANGVLFETYINQFTETNEFRDDTIRTSKHCYYLGKYPRIFLTYFPLKFKQIECQ